MLKRIAKFLFPIHVTEVVRYVDIPRDQFVLRLTPEVIGQLEAACNAHCLVMGNTSELQVAHQLGMQHVLHTLRKGFATTAI